MRYTEVALLMSVVYSRSSWTLMKFCVLLFPDEVLCVDVTPTVGCALFQCVVTPRRQSTAIALQILVSHLLGDAGSPYLIGVVSEFSPY